MPPTTNYEEHNNLSHHPHPQPHGDFDPDQVARLQDLARNGAPEAQLYAYSETSVNTGHLNSYSDNGSNDMNSNGLLQSQQDLDLDDPAALLESLANFEHTPSSNCVPVSNDHFASLLQAAATAGGAEAAQVGFARTRSSTRQSRSSEEPNLVRGYSNENRSRRRLNDKSYSPEIHGFVVRSTKRKGTLDDTDEEQSRREREIWGPEEPEDGQPYQESPYGHSLAGAAEARAAGVHSAAALFRRPSSASKKYTRPPMSKMFTSLELTPEQFLNLQAAAKVYMLDPKYPERRDCVGTRGSNDTDMVRLKLFACVKSFLEDEGWGDRCFGSSAAGAECRKLKWPQMATKVISAVTPLLRRMVTNERQRQYAVQSRKNTTNSRGKKTSRKATSPHDGPEASLIVEEQPHRNPEIDPVLDHYAYNLDPAFTSTTATNDLSAPPADQSQLRGDASASQDHLEASPPSETHLQYHVNILHNGLRIRPKLKLTPISCPGFSSLVQHVRSVLSSDSMDLVRVRALCPEGLMDVDGEQAWLATVQIVDDHEWMDGQVRVLVEVGFED